MSTSSQVVPVQEIPRVARGIVETLKEIFQLSIEDLSVLTLCEREERYGQQQQAALNPTFLTKAQWPRLRHLEKRRMVKYRITTEKYELTPLGAWTLMHAGELIRNVPLIHTGMADVLPFRKVGNSA